MTIDPIDTTHRNRAEHWIAEADNRDLPEAGRECLAAAQVHATLAVADALKGLIQVAEQSDHCSDCCPYRLMGHPWA